MGLIFAIAVVVLGWWAIKAFGKAQPQDFKKWKTQGLGFAVLALAGFIALRGNIEAGLGLLAIGLGLLNKDKMLPEFLRRGGPAPSQPPPPSPPRGPRMDRSEALHVLGLQNGATVDDIRNAHRRLQKDFHPDKGGSNYLAAKINEAKDVLLG
jgi:DnaJ homolog subfamily C member 19